MTINPIIISSFQWGLANDKNKGQKWAFWDAQGIEIRKNSEYVTLNRGVTNVFNTGTSKIVALSTTNYYSATTASELTDLENELNAFCDDWKIFNNLEGQIWDLDSDDCANVFYAKNWTTGYNYIIWKDKLWRFQNAVKEEILASSTFASGWTGTNWSAGVHTPWSTGQLSQSVSTIPVSWERYHIVVDVTSQSAWTCTVQIGWTVSGNLAVGRNDIYLTTVNAFSIFFNPSTTSTIVLNTIRVDRVSDLATSNWLWIKLIGSLTAGQTKRPCINYYWDLIIGDWNQLARYNKDGTIMLYSSSLEYPVLGWLDWVVYAITAIGTNIYVWCNNWGSTNMYIWDWITSRPTQKVSYFDKPVINVALLNNQHYWWSEKWEKSIKNIMIWEWYQAQRYITSDIPKALWTETLDDPDRLAIYWTSTNAIETFWDIVYLPWYGKIYGFGAYFPWDSISLNKEFTFLGTECTAMLTTIWGGTANNKDFSFYMIIWYKDLSNDYQVGVIDFRDYNGSYVSDWYIESMEYLGGNLWIEKNQKKLLVPFYLPHSSTSIEVYERKNQANSYTLIKTINTTDYSTGFNVAEIWDSGKWNTIQWKFKLITSDATYSPRLYVGVTDILLDTANRYG